MKRFTLIAAILLLASCGPREGIRRATPKSQGMDAARLELIDSAVNASISAGDIPGAVVGVVRHGRLVYEKAFGLKSVVPVKDSMTLETMFDLASVSKCVGTTLCFMQLVETGKVRLLDPVSRYIPDFAPWEDPKTHEKKRITVQDLLTHASGLDPYLRDVPGYVERFGAGTPDSLMQYIATKSERHFKPGTDKLYSCLNFITLQHILEKVTGERLCDYAQANVFDALGLKHTCYFPAVSPAHPELAPLCAPTEVLEDGHVLQAQVHDPTARVVNLGNSGNAGVFSNVEDLAVISAALLNGGSWNGRRILAPLTVQKMFAVPAGNAPCVARALGWDTYYREPYSSGDIFPLEQLRGHTGYTGTFLLLDPATDTALILLANRVHPADTGSVSRLRAVVASIVASSILR